MDIHVEPLSIEVSSGTGSTNTHNIHSGLLHQIVIASADTTTTYDFKLVDEDSLKVYDSVRRETTSGDGVLEDTPVIPFHGIYTATIYNASSDDTFTTRLLVRDH